MTSEEYRALLRELATISGLTDSSGLVDHGRVKVGEVNVVLEHEPRYDADLVQVRILLGRLQEERQSAVAKALLEANYTSGYGGECVFSVYPETNDTVLAMRLRLKHAMSAREFWQELSDLTRHGNQMWESITAKTSPSRGFPMDFHPAAMSRF